MKPSFVFFALLITTCALAQTPSPQYGIKQSSPPTGSRILRDAVRPYVIPINLSYEQLSPADRLKFHANYESLAPGDEPPFPTQGLVALLKPLQEAQQMLLVEGDLFLIASVDSAGKVSQVEVRSRSDPQMIQVAARILMLTPFKPAKCAGQPCIMDFPLYLDLKVN
jgi:hypothetical protein